MKTEHTRGKWNYTINGMGSGYDVFTNEKEGTICLNARYEDARLIAAAPDLLLACQGMLNVVRLWPHVSKEEVEKYLVEVIAKAEGKNEKKS